MDLPLAEGSLADGSILRGVPENLFRVPFACAATFAPAKGRSGIRSSVRKSLLRGHSDILADVERLQVDEQLLG